MQKNSSFIGLLISLGFVLIAYLVYQFWFKNPDQILLDNPIEKQIEILIDDETFSVSKNQTIKLNLEKGKHRIKYDWNNASYDTIFEVKTSRGVLNPTFSDYVLFHRPYGVGNSQDSLFEAHRTEIDNKWYFGKLNQTKSLWIDNFTLNLNQNYPKVVKKNEERKTSVAKIFRLEDFKQFYFENYE